MMINFINILTRISRIGAVVIFFLQVLPEHAAAQINNPPGSVSLSTGVTGNLSPSNGGKPSNRFTNFGSISPYTTASATYVMGGYGSTWTITPSTTGAVRIRISSVLTESSATGAPEFFINYGTGTAPTQGAATTGTNGTSQQAVCGIGAISINCPATYEFEITGLTLGTAYWFDVSLKSAIAGSATFAPMSVIIQEF